jgi:hypothetical protein
MHVAHRFSNPDFRPAQVKELEICRKACEEALRAIATCFPDVLIGDFEMRLGALIAQTPSCRSQLPLDAILGAMNNLRGEIEETFHRASQEPDEAHEEIITAGFDRIPLRLVLDACPALAEVLNAPVTTPQDLILAGKFVRNIIGAKLSDWHEATRQLGQIKAAVLTLLVFQMIRDDQTFDRHRIKDPAGVFRALLQRLAKGGFDLTKELSQLRRAHMT